MTKKSILLVDDEAAILHSFRKDLEMEHYSVSTAASGEEALTKLKEGHYDLVITDLVMAGAGGIRVLQEAKERDPSTCVFILTGYGSMTSAVDALRLGANDYLTKPCDPDELIIMIAHCLEKQELQRKVKLYEDMLPLCMYCKKIRDDTGTQPGEGIWMRLEKYLLQKSGINISHGCCPECFTKHKDD